MVTRLRTESMHPGGDAALEKAIAQLAADPATGDGSRHSATHAVVPARYRIGDRMVPVFPMFAQFGSAEDVTLADPRIELLFPADGETQAAFKAMADRALPPA
jgi:hypothetical protein